MTKKTQKYKIWNVHAFFLSLLASVSFCFFIGIFLNQPVRKIVFNNNTWHYVNRGYPVAWAGVSKPELSVNLPLIKAPFLLKTIYGTTFAKIIDLQVFLPLLLGIAAIFYPLAFFLTHITEKNRITKLVYIFLNVSLLFSSIYFYFFWFPRI